MAAPAARSGRQQAPAALLSIGQVLARLQHDFPDLTNSKLRFLEEQGLVSPSRTASGYRKFSADDIERVRTILTLQRDRYLPLKVIRAYLADLDAGIAAPQLGGSQPAAVRRTRSELLAETGASADLLAATVTAGLLPAVEPFDEDALQVLRSVVALNRVGIDPRHLRGMRHLAEREAALVESALRPLARRGDAAARARADELSGEISARLADVRGVLTRQAVARATS